MEDKKILENEKLDEKQLQSIAGGGSTHGNYYMENKENIPLVKNQNSFGNYKPEILIRRGHYL